MVIGVMQNTVTWLSSKNNLLDEMKKQAVNSDPCNVSTRKGLKEAGLTQEHGLLPVRQYDEQ